MNHISKPHLVDLLRIFDRRKFFVPRIRYASVRSKPELLKDLHRHFGTRLTKTNVEFLPKSSVSSTVPIIRYHLTTRKYYFDEEVVDPPTHCRHLPSFQILKTPVTLYFDKFAFPAVREGRPSMCTTAASSSESPEPSIGDPLDYLG